MARRGDDKRIQVKLTLDNLKGIERELKRRKRERRGAHVPTKREVINDLLDAGLRKGPKSTQQAQEPSTGLGEMAREVEAMLADPATEVTVYFPHHGSGSAVA